MASETLKSVQIVVAGRTYPVKLSVSDEEGIRRLEKQVNDKIKDFKLNYKDLDMVDCLSMTLLTYAFDLHKTRNVAHDRKLLDRIEEMEKVLDAAIE